MPSNTNKTFLLIDLLIYKIHAVPNSVYSFAKPNLDFHLPLNSCFGP